MTSKIKVDNINKVSDDSVIIKKCGSTTTVGSGSGNTIVVCGSTVTLGRCGGAVNIASGATTTGMGRAGAVDWQTSIKTTGFTAVSGEGYFCDTSSGSFTVTLPASPSAGAIVAVKDYANTFDTANLTLGRNGSNVGGAAQDAVIADEGIAVTVVYADATKGWLVTESGLQSEAPGPQFIAASGGCTSTSGDFKIHVFNSPGTFCVSNKGNAAGSNKVDYLVLAGGGGGGNSNGAGGGAGGYRESGGADSGCYSIGLPANAPVAGKTLVVQGYPIVVGAGGTAGTPSPTSGGAGSSSSFDDITSAGGGGGCNTKPGNRCGGSGAGGPHGVGPGGPPAIPTVGSGNTPPVSPSQGNPGGTGIDNKSGPTGTKRGGSGGGASATGGSRISPGPANTQNPTAEQAGGAGATSCITASPVARAGGGGGGAEQSPGMALVSAPGGAGGGGQGGVDPGGTQAVAGTVNTGGGGGGGGDLTPTEGKAGGSGIVVIRYKFQ